MKDEQPPSKARGNVASRRRRRTTIVLDTGIVLAVAAPHQIDEFQQLFPVDFVIPAKVLWELDRLKQRVETRDRARAALNVLKDFVDRGASRKSVSCGKDSTLRIASLEEEHPHPGLNMELADDCILAVAISLATQGEEVILATTEFALYAKAAAAGLRGMYLERYAEIKTAVSRRERESFRLAWARVQAANSPWSMCRRGLVFLRNPLVQRLIQPVRESSEPEPLAAIIAQFDHLESVWTGTTNLNDVMEDALGIAPLVDIDYSERIITEPAIPFTPGSGYMWPSQRRETPEERSIRIRRQEELLRNREDYIMDVVMWRLELIREFILDQIGEDIL